jgi:hypothetical protein
VVASLFQPPVVDFYKGTLQGCLGVSRPRGLTRDGMGHMVNTVLRGLVAPVPIEYAKEMRLVITKSPHYQMSVLHVLSTPLCLGSCVERILIFSI